MKDFLLLFSTLALLLSGFAVMERLDCWIAHTQQRDTILQKMPNKPTFRESLWINSRLYDKISLPKHATDYRGMGQCSSYKKGI